ncbi:MAG: ribonuclease Y [Acidobacteriota bacterium]
MAAHILIYSIVGLLLGIGLGLLGGWILNSRVGEKSLVRAREESTRLLEDAKIQGENLKKLELAKAREEFQQERSAVEEDYQKRFESVKNIERAMNRRDAHLQQVERDQKKRLDELGAMAAEIEANEAALQGRRGEIDAVIAEYNSRLEKAAGLTIEDAKKQLVANLKNEAEHEAANMIRRIKEEAQRTAEIEAQKIVTLAIERVAVDQVVERTTSQFKLPDEAIKGRLIGHEGRNIKFFEEQTGMQLLINNEDPNTVVISGFNPVAREIARQSLERLIQAGKIHPRKIQEVVTKVKKKVQREIQVAGEEAFTYLALEPPNPEILKLVGKLRYRTSYGQNVLNHSVEVAELCGNMAAELGLDVTLAKRAGLLHDIGKAIDVEREGTHPQLGGEAARKYGEHEVVINAIESHHEDVEVIHPISVLVAVCDAISGSRPGARRASLTDYLRRIETLENIVTSFEGVEQCFAIQAGREVRVIVKTDQVDDDKMPFLTSEMAKKIQDEMDYPGHIRLTMIREAKAVQYAG